MDDKKLEQYLSKLVNLLNKNKYLMYLHKTNDYLFFFLSSP